MVWYIEKLWTFCDLGSIELRGLYVFVNSASIVSSGFAQNSTREFGRKLYLERIVLERLGVTS